MGMIVEIKKKKINKNYLDGRAEGQNMVKDDRER